MSIIKRELLMTGHYLWVLLFIALIFFGFGQEQETRDPLVYLAFLIGFAFTASYSHYNLRKNKGILNMKEVSFASLYIALGGLLFVTWTSHSYKYDLPLILGVVIILHTDMVIYLRQKVDEKIEKEKEERQG